MLLRTMALFLVLISAGSAFAETKRVGFLVQRMPWDSSSITSRSQVLAAKLAEAGFEVIYREASGPPEIAYETRKFVEADRVDALIIRPSYSLPPQIFSTLPGTMPVVSFHVPLELPQAVYVGYDPIEIGKAQVRYLEAKGARQVLLLDAGSRSYVKELISAGQWQALRASSNMKAAADCGGCPKTGDCPKGQSAKECPCPKTGDCPKSAIVDVVAAANVDGIAILSAAFVSLIRDSDFGPKQVHWVAPMPTIDALREVADGKEAFAMDPQPIDRGVVDVTSKLLAKSSPKDISGVSKITLEKGETYAAFLPLSIVSDSVKASRVLDALKAGK